MGKNIREKQSKHRLNTRFVLVFSCALILCVLFTFGLTLSYFGGKSKGYSAEFILKAGIHFKENVTGTDYQKLTFDSNYMVPGTTLNANCLVTITSGTSDIANTAVNGLLRVGFNLSGNMMNFVSLNYSNDNPIYVYKGTTKSAMTEENKVARLVQAQDDDTYFYLVPVDTNEISNSTLLYEIPCLENRGEVSLVFDLSFTVTNISSDGTQEFTNSLAGKTATFTADFTVIQSEFYSNSTEPLDKTYKNAKTIFDDPIASEVSE